MSNEKKNANIVWNRLRSSLLAADEAIEEIIDGRLWEPLGYATFVEAWNDRMRGIKLAEAVEARVVYAMFDEGATQEEIIKATKIPDRRVEGLERAQDLGLSPELGAPYARRQRKRAEVTPIDDQYSLVSEHERRRPGPRTKVHLEVGTQRLAYWEGQYKKHGGELSFKQFMTKTLEDAMDQQINAIAYESED